MSNLRERGDGLPEKMHPCPDLGAGVERED